MSRAGIGGGFNVIVTALAAVAPVLEELSIGEGGADGFTEVPNWLAYTLPLSTFTHLEHLKILELSQEALLGREPAQGTMRLVQQFLPSSLKILRITWPYISILEWLQDVASYDECFPTLHEITLFPRESYGDGYELFVYKYYPVWEELDSENISVNIWWHPEDYRPEWEDADYDLFIIDIVAYLESLKPDAERVAEDEEDLGESDMEI
jgi:hypothetical protein